MDDQIRLPAREATLVPPRSTARRSCGAAWSGGAAVPALERRYAPGVEREALRAFLSVCPGCRRARLEASLRTALEPKPVDAARRSAARAP